MIRRPPRSTRTDTLFPYTTLFRSLKAIVDAGLTTKDIDGLSTFPGFRPDMPAFSPVGTMDLKESLNLKLSWFAGAMEGSAQLGAVINAYAAIKAGLARHEIGRAHV